MYWRSMLAAGAAAIVTALICNGFVILGFYRGLHACGMH